MEKTFLEKRIEERAEARYKKDLEEFVKTVAKNPIGTRLTIVAEDGVRLPLVNGGGGTTGGTFFNNSGQTKTADKVTNILHVKESLLELYKKEETEIFLNRMSDLEHFFNK